MDTIFFLATQWIINCQIPFIGSSGYDYQQVENEDIEIGVQKIGTMFTLEDYLKKQIVAAGKDGERKEVISKWLIIPL